MPRSVDIVIDYLRAQESHGVTHVDLDDRARAILNSLGKRKANPAPATAASPAAAEPAAITPIAPLHTSGHTKAERLADLRRQLHDYPRAHGLTQLRDTLVFSQGNPDARIAFIGDSPGHHDEQQGHPFAGAVGEKFDLILKAMNLSRAEVYLTHLVKFRPATKNQTTNNRAPTAQEVAAFLPVLVHEMEIIAPKVIVTLGSVPTLALCPFGQALESLRGAWHVWNGIPLRTSDAPSFLLTAANTKKRKFWEDMLAAMEQLDMPISEKQRSFFLGK
jgi:uracil-DNA glycosylase